MKSRMLPNLIVLTVPKTGSTSLYENFRDNNKICAALSKETWFFSDYFDKGYSWYLDQFSHCRNEPIVCDFISTLIYEKNFSLKLYSILPETKIIILLRDPIKRCVSHYLHEVRLGNESRPFDDAILNEDESLKTFPEKFSHLAYKGIGSIYLERIKELHQAYSKENIMVVLLEELISEEKKTFNKIYEFIGIDLDLTPFKRKNTARTSKNFFLTKASAAPINLYYSLINFLDKNSLIPQNIKVKTRVLRENLVRLLKRFNELSYREVDTNIMSPEMEKYLSKYYSNVLKGIEEFVSIKKINQYWPWFKNE